MCGNVKEISKDMGTRSNYFADDDTFNDAQITYFKVERVKTKFFFFKGPVLILFKCTTVQRLYHRIKYE